MASWSSAVGSTVIYFAVSCWETWVLSAFAVLSCVVNCSCLNLCTPLCVFLLALCLKYGVLFSVRRDNETVIFNNPWVHPHPTCILNGGESWFVGKRVPYMGDLSVLQYGRAVFCHWSVILVVHRVGTVIGNAANHIYMGEWGTYAGKGKLTSFICTSSWQYSPSTLHCVGTAAGLDEIAFPEYHE